uniref:Solute carrier family 23 member 3 n=1 Tax=Scleropages formosus TaxID=113540 RepID=A0A8C9RQ69_SCLFO
QSSLLVLVVGILQEQLQLQEGEEERLLASGFFHSAVSTLLQGWLGTRLPLLQTPSPEFIVPAIVLTHRSPTCPFQFPSHLIGFFLPQLQGMVLTSGLVQFVLGASGLSGPVLQRSGPLVLAPLLCVLGFSIYREAAVLCSEHWGIASLAVLLVVFLSQHLHSWPLLATVRYPVFRMVSVSPCTESHSTLGIRLPLLSTLSVAAGVAAALSSFISSLGVYVLTARLLGTSPPPPYACNRGLCAEGLGTVSAALLGGPLGVSSSVPNACVVGLSQCGSRRSVQLAAMMSLLLGVSPRLSQLLTSFPLGVQGAVLSVTYTVAAGTGITYFRYTHMDSGRNIFNIGFAIFMSLLLPRWFNLHPSFITTGVSSLDVLLQSLITLPVFLAGFLAFFLDNTVSGSLSERGLSSTAMKKRALDDRVAECSQNHFKIYDPPEPVRRMLDLPGIRVVPFCACRNQISKDVGLAAQENSDLLNGLGESHDQDQQGA